MNTAAVLLPDLTVLPRCVVLDLDGTLLDPSGALRDRSREALHWLLDREVPVILATARPLRSVRAKVGVEIVQRVSVVHMNGLGVVHGGTASVVASPLPVAAAERVIALAASLAPGARVVCEIGGERFGCDTPMDVDALWTFNAATPDMVMPVAEALGTGIVKVALNGLGVSLSGIADAIEAELGTALTVIREASGSFLNVLPPGTSKEGTLARLLPADDPWGAVLAFGDDLGDTAMLRLARYGVAMANAHPEVTASAPYRTYSNDQDGVAHVIERLRARHP